MKSKISQKQSVTADTPRFLVTGAELKQLGQDLAGLIGGEISTNCNSEDPASVLEAWRRARKDFAGKGGNTPWDAADLDRLAAMLERILPMLEQDKPGAEPVERFVVAVTPEIARRIRFVADELGRSAEALIASAAVSETYAMLVDSYPDDERDVECEKAEQINAGAMVPA